MVLKQETAKDGMAGLQSGNKIWEDLLRTSLNAMVNLNYCMTLKFEWTKSRSQKHQQKLGKSIKNKLKCKGSPKLLSDLEQKKWRSGSQGKVTVQETSPRSIPKQGIESVLINGTENELKRKG